MFNTTVLILTFVIASTFYLYYKYRKWIDIVNSIPGPPGLPLLGNILEFPSVEFVLPKYTSYFKEYGRTFRLYVAGRVYIVTCDQKIIQNFVGRPKDLPKPHFYAFLRKWWGNSLPLSSGIKWKNRRKLFHSAMHSKILEDSVSIFNKASDVLIQKLQMEVGRSFDIRDMISRCSLDIISEASMGVAVNAQMDPNNEYGRAIEELGQLFTTNTHSFLSYFPFLYPLTENYKKEEKALKIVNDLSRSVIKERKKKLEKGEDNNGRRLNLLDQLLEAKEDGQPLSERDIREEVNVALFAGHDTTATTISHTLWALAKNPEIQDKLFKKLEIIMGKDSTQNETYEDLQQMEYLDWVLKESLRMYPAAPFVGRKIDEDEDFGGFKFMKGEVIIPFFRAVHMDPEYFPDPEKFDPERFSPENAPKQNLAALIPFGLGPRICVGQKFAILEGKAVISKILRNFVLHAEPNHELDFIVGTVLTARNGVKIRFERR